MQDKHNPPQSLADGLTDNLAEKTEQATASKADAALSSVPSSQQSGGLVINEEVFSGKLFSDEPVFSDSTNSSTANSTSNASNISSEELLFTDDEAQSTSQNNNDSDVLFSDVPTPDKTPQTDKPTQTASSEVLFADEATSSSEEILFADDTISDDEMVIFAETPVDNTAVTNDMLFANEPTAEGQSTLTENDQPASTATSEELLFTDEPVFADEPASNSAETLFADDTLATSPANEAALFADASVADMVADTVNDDENILIAETAVDNVAITDDVLFADEASQKEQTQETAAQEIAAQEKVTNETTTANTAADTKETLFADEPVFSDAAAQAPSEALFADEPANTASHSEEVLFADTSTDSSEQLLFADEITKPTDSPTNSDKQLLFTETATDNAVLNEDMLFADEPVFSDTAQATNADTLFTDEPVSNSEQALFADTPALSDENTVQQNAQLMSPVAALTSDANFQQQLNISDAHASPLQENIALQTLAQDTSLTARLGFFVGNTPLLIPVIEGDLLMDVPDMFKLPNTADWFLGYSNINGNLIPIFDIADFLNLSKINSQAMQEQALATAQHAAADASQPMQKLLVVMHDEDAAGIIINSLPKKLNLQAGTRISVDTAHKTLVPYLAAAARIDEQIWFDLNIEALLDAIEARIE